MLVNDFLFFTYLYSYKMLPLEEESLINPFSLQWRNKGKKKWSAWPEVTQPLNCTTGSKSQCPNQEACLSPFPTMPQICSIFCNYWLLSHSWYEMGNFHFLGPYMKTGMIHHLTIWACYKTHVLWPAKIWHSLPQPFCV